MYRILIGINLKRKCISLVLFTQIYDVVCLLTNLLMYVTAVGYLRIIFEGYGETVYEGRSENVFTGCFIS